MTVYLNYWTAFPVGALLISLFIIIYFWLKGRKTTVLYSYIAFQSLIFTGAVNIILLDILFYSGIYSSWAVWLVDYGIKGFVDGFLGLSWLIFCLFYTRNRLGIYKKIIIYLTVQIAFLLIISLIDSTSVLIPNSSGWHFLGTDFWTDSFYYIQSATSIGCIIFGTVLLIKHAVLQSGDYRKQLLFVIAAMLFLMTIEIIHIVFTMIIKIPFWNPDLNILSIGYLATAVFFGIAIFKYRFLDIIPVALRKIVDSMKEAIIVVDDSNRILEFNSSLVNGFGAYLPAVNGDFKDFIERLEHHLIDRGEKVHLIEAMKRGFPEQTSGELCLEEKEKRYYMVNIQPLTLDHKNCLGRVISFSDISDYRSLVAELAAIKERNRLARDVHDTLGHAMVTLITQLKVMSITCETDTMKTQEKITEAIAVAKNGLQELRRSIAGFKSEQLEDDNLTEAIGKLARNFREAGVEVNLTLDGNAPYNPNLTAVLFRVCQEALTNSLRHGGARQVTIVMRWADDAVKLLIVDDGTGCRDIKKGFGIRGMEQRVRELNGVIRYGSGDEGGFSVYVEIPVKRDASERREGGMN